MHAVREVAAGRSLLDPLTTARLLEKVRSPERPDPLDKLSERERSVLELIGQGLSNREIAERLFIGVGAVEKNVTSIFQKLQLDDSGSDHRRVLAVLAFLQR